MKEIVLVFNQDNTVRDMVTQWLGENDYIPSTIESLDEITGQFKAAYPKYEEALKGYVINFANYDEFEDITELLFVQKHYETSQ